MKSSYMIVYYIWTIGILFLGIFGLWIIMLYKEDAQNMKEQFKNYPANPIPNMLPPNPNMPDKPPKHVKI